MGNKLINVGLIMMFGATLAMTMQKSFEFGYGIAAGIFFIVLGLNRKKK